MIFAERMKLFLELCVENDIPEPDVAEALMDDPCDYTDHRRVRLNIPAASGVDPYEHVAHVWGHYVCCLHEWADNQTGCARITDRVADAIGRLALRGRRWVMNCNCGGVTCPICGDDEARVDAIPTGIQGVLAALGNIVERGDLTPRQLVAIVAGHLCVGVIFPIPFEVKKEQP